MNFFDFSQRDIAIDLGTSNILVISKDSGIILKEPSILALNQKNMSILATGKKAQDLLDKTPDTLKMIRPFRDGVIADYKYTLYLLKDVIKKAGKQFSFRKPRVLVGVPVKVTEIECMAIEEVLIQAGASEVLIIYEPVASAIGLGLDVLKPEGNAILDIGGGRTQFGVVSLGSVVSCSAIKVGGNYFNQKIIEYLKRRLNFGINISVAEDLKIDLGCATPLVAELITQIRGIDTATGVPKNITVTSKDIKRAMEKPLELIMESVIYALSNTPPELLSDILKNGIHIVGGGALIRNIDNLVFDVTGIKTYIADEPFDTVILGMQKIINNLEMYKDILM